MTKQLKIGDAAPAGLVIATDDQEISLDTLWGEGPTLLTFLRHFG